MPPVRARLGDTWARSIDGMSMGYVPDGEFQMGSDDHEVGAELAMCQVRYTTRRKRDDRLAAGPAGAPRRAQPA